SVLLADVAPDVPEGVGRDARRVCAHVGDEADRSLVPELDSLVELLGDRHRAPGAETELSRRFLLQARGDERRRGMPPALFGLYARDLPAGVGKAREQRVGGCVVLDAQRLVVETLAADFDEPGRE